eukprot:6214267-Pleurochrysis_carterae.AAC.2
MLCKAAVCGGVCVVVVSVAAVDIAAANAALASRGQRLLRSFATLVGRRCSAPYTYCGRNCSALPW